MEEALRVWYVAWAKSNLKTSDYITVADSTRKGFYRKYE